MGGGKVINAASGHVNAAIDWRQTHECMCVCVCMCVCMCLCYVCILLTGCQADSNDSCLRCDSLWREAADSGMPCFPTP